MDQTSQKITIEIKLRKFSFRNMLHFIESCRAGDLVNYGSAIVIRGIVALHRLCLERKRRNKDFRFGGRKWFAIVGSFERSRKRS